jgi:ketosteroid isomerase-like protein
MSTDATRNAVLEHLAAFNSHDQERLLGGLDENIVWSTGADRFEGREAMRDLFDPWLWDRAPRLDLIRLIVEGDAAAAECLEHMVIDGTAIAFPLAVFFTVRDDLLVRVKVFREGSADLPSVAGST